MATASANCVNGFGTQLCFKGDRKADGSFVTTKFLVLLYLPLIPLASFRVRDLTSDAGARTRCQSAVAPEPVGLDWRQALCGAAVVVTTLIAIVAWSRLAS